MTSQIRKRIGSVVVLLLLMVAVLSVVVTVQAAEEGEGGSGDHTITVLVDESEYPDSGTIVWYNEDSDKAQQSGDKCQNNGKIRVVAIPKTGYKVKKIVCQGKLEYTQSESWEYEPVTQDLIFVVSFVPKEYELVSITSEPAGVQYGFEVGKTIQKGDKFEFGTDVTLPTPQIDTYVFQKWILNGTIELTNNVLPLNVDYPDGIRLTAVFEPKKYSVTVIDIDAGTEELIGSRTLFEWPYNELVKVDGSMELPTTLPEREGYTYFRASEGRKVKVSENENIFYRWFTPNNYMVSLDNGNAAAVGGKSSLTVDFNRPFDDLDPADLPTLAGYSFAGYFDKPNGAGKQYIGADGKAFVENGKDVRWDVASNEETLYAHWVPNAYTVDFDSALSENATITVRSGGNTYVYAGSPLDFRFGSQIEITVTAKDGYKLVSWNGDALTHTREQSFSFTVPAENTTLTGNVLPVCTVPSFSVDYINEVLTAPGGIPSGSYVLRVGDTDLTFTGDGAPVSLSNYFGSTVRILCRGDGVVTADSEWRDLVLAARPVKPVYGEGGVVEKPSTTENSVSFTVSDSDTVNYEFAYSLRTTDKLVWRDTGSFEELKPGTTYTFYIRVKATETAPHGEEFSMTVYTLNENYLKGEIEKLRGNMQEGDDKNVSDLITIYVTKMEALQPSANYQEELQELINECLAKLTLARYKDQVIAAIDARRDELLAGNLYNDDGKATLNQLRDDAEAAINDAATTTGVDNARKDFDSKVAEIPVRIDLTWLLVALGTVIFLQIVVLAILLTRRAKYADRVKYARGKAIYGFATPAALLTAQFLPEKPALIALLLGVIALVLQIVIMVLIFRTAAITKKTKPQNGGSRSGNTGSGTPAQSAQAMDAPQTPPAEDTFAFQPQMSVFHDEDAPTFEEDDFEDELQEDWYDETPTDDDADAYSFAPDDSDDGNE